MTIKRRRLKVSDAAAYMKTLTVPEGFTLRRVKVGEQLFGWGGHYLLTKNKGGMDPLAVWHLCSETIQLEFRFERTAFNGNWKGGKALVVCQGTTRFLDDQGRWRSWDRHGIEDSFYCNGTGNELMILDGLVTEQNERCEKWLKQHVGSVPVPGLRVLTAEVTPTERDEIGAVLRTGGTHLFAPSGMGTALKVSVKRPVGRFGIHKMFAETAEFFGCKELWSEDVDWD
jgi:hypothetical protein